MYYLFLAAVLSFVAVFTLISGINGAASIPSPGKIVEEMVDLMGCKKGRVYYDLGAGGGRILRKVSQKDAVAIGFEYAPLTYLLAIFFLILKPNKKVKIFWKNFYRQNFKNADGIFCYLSPRAMQLLEPKFTKELKGGASVVTYAFKLPNKKEEKIIKIKNYAPIYKYKF